MVDNRFPGAGADARFRSPGVDTRFGSIGVDAEQPADGTDTRFQGTVYGGAATLAVVSAFLARSTRYAQFDGALLRFQTNDTSTPVTAAGQDVGYWGGTGSASPLSFAQATLALRPVARDGYVEFDNLTRYLDGDANMLNLGRNTGVANIWGRVTMRDLAAQEVIASISTGDGVGQSARIEARTSGTNGFLIGNLRRVDGDAQTHGLAPTNGVTANVPFSFLLTFDFAAGLLSGYVNGSADLLVKAIPSPGVTSNTPALRARIGSNLNIAVPICAPLNAYKLGFSDGAAPTAAERAALFNTMAG